MINPSNKLITARYGVSGGIKLIRINPVLDVS